VYQDKKKIIKRIKRDSVFGGEVIKFYREVNGDVPVRGEGGLQRAANSVHVVFTESKTAYESRKLNPDKSQGSPFVKLPKPPYV